jgi:hypothetical protein
MWFNYSNGIGRNLLWERLDVGESIFTMAPAEDPLRISPSLVIGVFLLFMTAVNTNAAGFDCSKAMSDVEKLICDDDELSKLDESLNEAYRKALKQSDIKNYSFAHSA